MAETIIHSFEQAFTTWINPTPHEQRVPIRVGTDRTIYVIPPGGELRLPSRYDDAVHERDKSGVIVAGLAPLLRKKGEEDYRLHPAIDPDAAAKKQAEAELLIADARRRAADTDHLVALGKHTQAQQPTQAQAHVPAPQQNNKGR